jgi:hypothetical protein
MTGKNLLVAVLSMLIVTSCNNNGKEEKIENKQAADTSVTGIISSKFAEEEW